MRGTGAYDMLFNAHIVWVVMRGALRQMRAHRRYRRVDGCAGADCTAPNSILMPVGCGESHGAPQVSPMPLCSILPPKAVHNHLIIGKEWRDPGGEDPLLGWCMLNLQNPGSRHLGNVCTRSSQPKRPKHASMSDRGLGDAQVFPNMHSRNHV